MDTLIILVIFALISLSIILCVYKMLTNSYIFSPISMKTAEKLNLDWFVCKHLPTHRLVKREKVQENKEEIMGVVKIDNILSTFNVKCDISPNSLDIFEYDKKRENVGKLVYSIPNIKRVTLGNGEWYLNGKYIVLLRHPQKTNLDHLRISATGPELISPFVHNEYHEVEENENEVNIEIDDDDSYKLYPKELYPPSNNIILSTRKFNLESAKMKGTIYSDNETLVISNKEQRSKDISVTNATNIATKHYPTSYSSRLLGDYSGVSGEVNVLHIKYSKVF